MSKPTAKPEAPVSPAPLKGTTCYVLSPRDGHRDVFRVTFDGKQWTHVMVQEKALPVDARVYVERWNRLAEQDLLEGPK